MKKYELIEKSKNMFPRSSLKILYVLVVSPPVPRCQSHWRLPHKPNRVSVFTTPKVQYQIHWYSM